MPLPSGLLIEVAFAATARDQGALVWTDVTSRAMAFSTERGRKFETDVCDPGTVNVVLLNNDGLFDNDSSASYAGNIIPNKRVRVSALNNGSVRQYLGYAYADGWNRTWPGGQTFSVTELKATDRFKLLNKRQNTGTTTQEQAHIRMAAILNAGNTNGVNCIVPTAEYSLNPEAYACRTLVAHTYAQSNTLSNLQEAAISDGGALFVNGAGILRFQSTRYRTDNIRSNTSQATFGNSTTATVPLSADDPPELINDDVRLANFIRVTDGRGKEFTVSDAPSITLHDRAEMDLGGTLLAALDAPDRIADVLLLRKSWAPRYESLTINGYGSNAALQQALDREISDRITLAIIPKGQTTGSSRAYIIEGISHTVTVTSWKTKFRLSPVGASTAISS